MAFNTAKFIDEHLVNTDYVVGLARQFSVDVPPKDTLRKWFERKSIPGEWWPVILALLEMDNGRPVSLRQYIGDGRVGNAADIFG